MRSALSVEAALLCRAVASKPFRLEARDARLGGNVPLRAAQACPPFLAGNALGFQLSPPRPIAIERRFGRLLVDPVPARARALGPREIELTFDTGLALEPAPGVVLCVERAYNRRDQRVTVVEQELAAPTSGTLHITLRVRLSRKDGPTELAGELASITPFAPTALPHATTLAQAPDVGRAHLAFFDRSYFDDKRAAPTGKYRARLAGRAEPPADAGEARMLVVHAGGAAPTLARSAAGVVRVELPLELDAVLRFHGQRVAAELDPKRLAARARGIEAVWGETFGELAAPTAGAVLYFTGYATPHAPGDPHVFFKPATLASLAPGWLAVLDGPAGDGWEVLRGVTVPSLFHALPAVIELHRERVALAAGTPLLRVRPVPERLAHLPLAWA